MKKILLTPYPGYVLVARNKAEFLRGYKKHTRQDCTFPVGRGVTSRMALNRGQLFLVYATDLPSLVHEFSHVVLDLFGYVNADPRESNGEPFAYMMSHLMEEYHK